MTDRARLAGDAAAANTANYVELLAGLGELEGLTNDQLEGIKAEVIVDISVVDGDLTGARIEANSCYRRFSSAGAVKIRCLIVHLSFLLLKIPMLRASEPDDCAQRLRRV